ncbi:hypothetical protein FEM48_Zijuj02G0210100 [Ziziphus jujuba var. spinosa]|uniref:Uncharacterized protein n=1 Tax=Ziziphus jujuba var. spinosa TaxID=714518 RepID=A0A978VXX7_ZIZJJ|nr:hypothetical protein FEM48_Zijuj02G0210100 [Ziziphus jujuba var. spinosa]
MVLQGSSSKWGGKVYRRRKWDRASKNRERANQIRALRALGMSSEAELASAMNHVGRPVVSRNRPSLQVAQFTWTSNKAAVIINQGGIRLRFCLVKYSAPPSSTVNVTTPSGWDIPADDNDLPHPAYQYITSSHPCRSDLLGLINMRFPLFCASFRKEQPDMEPDYSPSHLFRYSSP